MSLEIVSYDHPIMRKCLRELSPEEIRTPDVQELMSGMRDLMREKRGVGLAANQVNVDAAVIVVEDRPEYLIGFSEEYLDAICRKPVAYHALVNPDFSVIDGSEICLFEGCLCRPDVMGVVPTPFGLHVEALNENGDPVSFDAFGFYARILRHEIQHLVGIQYFDIMLPGSLIPRQEFVDNWKTATPGEIARLFGYVLPDDPRDSGKACVPTQPSGLNPNGLPSDPEG